MKKILIIYATAGEGHKNAALAVKAALDEIKPNDIEVSIIDSIDYTNAFYKWTYFKAYLFMVDKLPALWGLSYYLTNNFYVNLIAKKFRWMNDWSNSKRLRDYLLATQPDVVVSTHFFSSDIVCDLNRKGLLRSHIISVVTDYRFHVWWVAPCTERYVVGSEEAKEDLLRWGITPNRVKVLGIPIGPLFSKPLEQKAILDKLNFRGDVPILLVGGGGLGSGPIEEMVKAIDTVSRPVQTIVVCGRNEKLFKRLEVLKPDLKHEIRIFGFVDNVHEYMEVSDILVSKCGGITAAESLAKELPMVIVCPIIGQETRNAAYFASLGVALTIDKLSDLKGVLEDLFDHPEKLHQMRQVMQKLKRPTACYDIAQMAIEICKNGIRFSPLTKRGESCAIAMGDTGTAIGSPG